RPSARRRLLRRSHKPMTNASNASKINRRTLFPVSAGFGPPRQNVLPLTAVGGSLPPPGYDCAIATDMCNRSVVVITATPTIARNIRLERIAYSVGEGDTFLL